MMVLLNIFTILNLEIIKIKYRLFKVKGVLPQSEDFDKNVQLLIDRLSRIMKSPCAVIKEGGELFVAQPAQCPDLPSRLPLIGAEALIEPYNVERLLDYGKLNETDAGIATRFLQFSLNGHLHHIQSLWQPSAGMPYFHKDSDPDFRSPNVVMYRGFRIRLMSLPGNKLGVCVDITRKYASRHYLPAKIEPNEFRRYKGTRCIYEFGHRWYEIRIEGISGLNATEERMPDGSSLIDYIYRKTRKPRPQALLGLRRDCTVLTYQTKLGIVKRVPSALCRPAYATSHPEVSEFHSRTIIPPHKRRNEIESESRTYLGGWSFRGVPIVLSKDMLRVECGVLTPPDLEFGGGRILSLQETGGAVHTTLEDFGSAKWRLLHSTDAGFYVKKRLDRQYLIMPYSMQSTFGSKYLDELKAQFTKLYSPDGKFQYDPIVITYDDSGSQSVYALGNEILQSLMRSTRNVFFSSGYGLVIIPRLESRTEKEDVLANLLMSELRKRDIYVSISHTETPSMSYIRVLGDEGEAEWRVIDDKHKAKTFRGYLENVVLNKILLQNHCWPFVLSRPLNTDLVIGLDVKNNTAGFMLIFKEGRTFSFKTSDSGQKEQLSRGHVSSLIHDYLKSELEEEPRKIRDITIHRDGILYPPEMKGIEEALSKLHKEGFIEDGYNCNFIEIKKTSRIPVRFFDTTSPQGSTYQRTDNPQIGTYKVFLDDAFLCTTGQPFRYPGTTKPLQVFMLKGNMDFNLILEDIFSLANLTWTRPDSCSRLPISIKMTDIRLRELAGHYEEDKLKFSEEEEE